MNISTSPNASTLRARPAQSATKPESAPASADSVTLSGRPSSSIDLKETLTWGLAGAVPGLGAVSNFTIGALTLVSGQKKASDTALMGLGANLLGTGALVTGLIIGNTATSLIGGGLLMASGVAAGYSINQNN